MLSEVREGGQDRFSSVLADVRGRSGGLGKAFAYGGLNTVAGALEGSAVQARNVPGMVVDAATAAGGLTAPSAGERGNGVVGALGGATITPRHPQAASLSGAPIPLPSKMMGVSGGQAPPDVVAAFEEMERTKDAMRAETIRQGMDWGGAVRRVAELIGYERSEGAKGLLEDAAGAIPQLAGGIASGVAGTAAGGPLTGMAAAAGFFAITDAGSQTSDVYKRLLAEGMDEKEAATRAADAGKIYGLASGALEFIGVGSVVGKPLKKHLLRAAESRAGKLAAAGGRAAGAGAAEGLTEVAQGVLGEAVMALARKDWEEFRSTWNDLDTRGREFAVGALLGTAVRGGVEALDPSNYRSAEEMLEAIETEPIEVGSPTETAPTEPVTQQSQAGEVQSPAASQATYPPTLQPTSEVSSPQSTPVRIVLKDAPVAPQPDSRLGDGTPMFKDRGQAEAYIQFKKERAIPGDKPLRVVEPLQGAAEPMFAVLEDDRLADAQARGEAQSAEVTEFAREAGRAGRTGQPVADSTPVPSGYATGETEAGTTPQTLDLSETEQAVPSRRSPQRAEASEPAPAASTPAPATTPPATPAPATPTPQQQSDSRSSVPPVQKDTREPWEMDGAELLKLREDVRRGAAPKINIEDTTQAAYVEYQRLSSIEATGSKYGWDKVGEANAKVQHRRAVQAALASGKPVPAEVLAEYPDLAQATPPAGRSTGSREVPAQGGVREGRPEYSTPASGMTRDELLAEAERLGVSEGAKSAPALRKRIEAARAAPLLTDDTDPFGDALVDTPRGAANPSKGVEQPLAKTEVRRILDEAMGGVTKFEQAGKSLRASHDVEVEGLTDASGSDYIRLLGRVFGMDHRGELTRADTGGVVGIDSSRLDVGDAFDLDGERVEVIEADDQAVTLRIGDGERVLTKRGQHSEEHHQTDDVYGVPRGKLIPANKGSLKQAGVASKPPTAGDKLRNLADRLESSAREANAKMNVPRGRSSGATLPPAYYANLVKIGAAKVLRGVAKFSDFAAQMIESEGDWIEPSLRDIYRDSLELAGDMETADTIPTTEEVTRRVNARREREANATSARVADIETDRADLGLDALDSPARRSWQEAHNTAKAQGIHGRAMQYAAEVNAKPRALSDIETAGLVQRAAELKKHHRQVMAQMADADPAQTATLAAEAARIESEFDALSEALRKSGTEKGRALASQRLALDQDFSLIAVKARAKAAKGESLTEKQEALITNLVRRLEDADARAAKAEARLKEAKAQQAVKTHKKNTKRPPKIRAVEFDAKLARARELLAKGCR